MTPNRRIIRLIHFDPLDYRIVRDLALANGLNRHSFSAALHWIITEWFALRVQAETRPPPQVNPETNLLDELPRILAVLNQTDRPGPSSG